MQNYELTLEAEADVREIAQYTFEQWGKKQAMEYATALTHAFEAIGSGRAISRAFSERFPDVRMTRCEQHYVFYLHSSSKKPCILAILHKRMNMLMRLADRLTTN
jgi:toxin ParE1/3/4